MKGLRSKILSCLAVACVAIPASAHAVRERRAELRAQSELARLTDAIGPVGFGDPQNGRVMLNGAQVHVVMKTFDKPLAAVMGDVATDCKSGEHNRALGIDPGPGEGTSRPIKLERVVSQESPANGAMASLCLFAPESGVTAPGGAEDGVHEPTHRVRYTLAHQLDDGRTAVTTVTNESSTPLSALFPADGDAPGSDIPGLPRPADAKRTLTAAVGDGTWTVRIYESTRSVESSMADFDSQMTERGFATTGALPTARMYRRDGKSFVASWLANSAGCNVTVAPFEVGAVAKPKPTVSDLSP